MVFGAGWRGFDSAVPKSTILRPVRSRFFVLYRYNTESYVYYTIMARRSPDLLVSLLTSKAPVTFPQLQVALANASRTTTFEYLKQIRYVRSYNHNGRYYTLRDRLRFDRRGLAALGDIRFSRDGTLGATVLRLVDESCAGCTHKELRARLHAPVNAILLAAVRRQALRRERMEGVWVYRSSDPVRGAAQRSARQARIARRAAAALPAQVIIEVLLALLRHPGESPEQVACRLREQAPPITLSQVTGVLERFDLVPVTSPAGTADCASRGESPRT